MYFFFNLTYLESNWVSQINNIEFCIWIVPGTAPSNGAIWDEFNEHQSTRKAPYLIPYLHVFNTNKV